MFVILVVLVLVGLFSILDYVKKRQFDQISNHIPTVQPCYPLVGNGLMFNGLSQEGRFKLMNEIFRKSKRIAKAWFGPLPVIFVAHPDLVQRVLSDVNCCDRPLFYGFLGLGDSVFTAEYSLWRPQRKKLNPMFNAKIVQQFASVFERCAQHSVESLRNLQGVPIDIFEHTTKCAFQMLLETTLGTNVQNDSENEQFLDCLKSVSKVLEKRGTGGILLIDGIYRLTEHYQIEKQCRLFMDNFCLKVINEKRKTLLSNTIHVQPDKETRESMLFIDQLLSMFNADDDRDIKLLINQLLVTIIAGVDTVGSTIGFTCLFLAMFPHHQEKLAEEILAVFPSYNSPITPEYLNHLPFLDQVLKESMRIAPVPTFIGRRNITDITLDGHCIPRGTTLALNLFDLHRRPEVWGPNANHFDPENFLPERVEGRHPFGYLPFGAGMRNCIGMKYAMVNTKIMLIYILRNFKLKTESKFDDLKFSWSVSLNLTEKHNIILESRS